MFHKPVTRWSLLVLLALLFPGYAHAQLSPTPLDASDKRLQIVRPIAEALVQGDFQAVSAVALKHFPGDEGKDNMLGQLRAVTEEFGGSKYEIQAYLTGRGRDVVVELKNKADSVRYGFAVVFDPETEKFTGFVPVRFGG